jgi:uncharacterized protein (TIGR02453 family)
MPTSAAPATEFTGFSPDAIQFLADLAQNNDRAWFQPRKATFDQLLREPMEAMIAALADELAARRVPIVADPKRSPFRIYRDTRFAKDKSPYKTHLGATFAWAGSMAGVEAGGGHDERAHGNGGYFHLQPGEMYVGGGMWRMDRPVLERFRAAVRDDAERVTAALEEPGFVAVWGEVRPHDQLKRFPPGWPHDHPDAAKFLWKDVVFGQRLGDDEVLSADLPARLADRYAAAAPVFRFLQSLR